MERNSSKSELALAPQLPVVAVLPLVFVFPGDRVKEDLLWVVLLGHRGSTVIRSFEVPPGNFGQKKVTTQSIQLIDIRLWFPMNQVHQ